MLDKITTTEIENSSAELEAVALSEKNKFMEQRIREYFLKSKGNITEIESIEEENGEYFVSAKFNLERDETLYGFLARGLKMSINAWPEKKSWDAVAQEIVDMNGGGNFKIADGQMFRVPIKRFIDTASWEEEFQAELEEKEKAEGTGKRKSTCTCSICSRRIKFTIKY